MRATNLILFLSMGLGLFLSPLRAMDNNEGKSRICVKKQSTKKVRVRGADGSLNGLVDHVGDVFIEATGGLGLLFDELLEDIDKFIDKCVPNPDCSEINRPGKFYNHKKKSYESKSSRDFKKIYGSGPFLAKPKPLPLKLIQKSKEEFIPAPLQQIFKIKNMKTEVYQVFSVPIGVLYEELYKKIDAYAKTDPNKQQEWGNDGILFAYNCFDCTAYEYEETPGVLVEEGIPALYFPRNQ